MTIIIGVNYMVSERLQELKISNRTQEEYPDE